MFTQIRTVFNRFLVKKNRLFCKQKFRHYGQFLSFLTYCMDPGPVYHIRIWGRKRSGSKFGCGMDPDTVSGSVPKPTRSVTLLRRFLIINGISYFGPNKQLTKQPPGHYLRLWKEATVRLWVSHFTEE